MPPHKHLRPCVHVTPEQQPWHRRLHCYANAEEFTSNAFTAGYLFAPVPLCILCIHKTGHKTPPMFSPFPTVTAVVGNASLARWQSRKSAYLSLLMVMSCKQSQTDNTMLLRRYKHDPTLSVMRCSSARPKCRLLGFGFPR